MKLGLNAGGVNVIFFYLKLTLFHFTYSIQKKSFESEQSYIAVTMVKVPMTHSKYSTELGRALRILQFLPLVHNVFMPTGRHSGYETLPPKHSKVLILLYIFGFNSSCLVAFQLVRFFQVSIFRGSIEELLVDYLWLTGYAVSLFYYVHFVGARIQISAFLNMLLIFERRIARTI